MGLLEAIFGKKADQVKAQDQFGTFTTYQPKFRTFNGKIYESDLIRAAIEGTATHCSKLKVDVIGSAQPKLRTILKHRPNPWEPWSKFLSRVATIREVQNNVFIVPVLGEYGETTGYYPVVPSECSIKEYNGKPYLIYRFVTGDQASMELNRCGILTKFQYMSEFFGESNSALNRTMDMTEIQNQAIEEGVKNSNTFQFMARASNFNKDVDLKKEQERFKQNNLSGSGGVLLFPNTYQDVKQIDYKAYKVDKEQADAIKENVLNYFGTNIEILQNKADGDALDAFFNGKIEPFSIMLSEVLTQMTFTDREMSAGAAIQVSANRLQYMPTKQKIAMVQQLGDRGMLLIDEARELFNYEPLPDGKGQKAFIRGEYYDVQKKALDDGEDGDNEGEKEDNNAE